MTRCRLFLYQLTVIDSFKLQITAIPTKSDAVEIIIAVMGMTGSGKSHLIQQITGSSDIEVGHTLKSSHLLPSWRSSR